jgi:hypothetical protein
MARNPSAQRTPGADLPSLTERVESHVAQTALTVKRGRRSSSPLGRRAGRVPAPDAQQAALRAVFRELGETHRAYRARTGQGGTPALRAAAHAFKRAPSLPALVTVAAFFDELGLLAW